jgi:hypothetical protein
VGVKGEAGKKAGAEAEAWKMLANGHAKVVVANGGLPHNGKQNGKMDSICANGHSCGPPSSIGEQVCRLNHKYSLPSSKRRLYE